MSPHSWTQLSGPPVALAGASTTTPTFEAPNEDAELEFEVTVDDGRGGSDSDSVSVLVTAKRARLYIANISGHSVTSYEDPALVNGNLPRIPICRAPRRNCSRLRISS